MESTNKPQQISVHKMDSWTLLPQEAQAHPQAGRMHLEDVIIVIKHRSDQEEIQIAHEIYGNPFVNAPFSQNITFEALFYHKETSIAQLELQYEGKTFWSLNKNLVTAARYGHYVVFITQDHIHETHLRLSFIDLSYFKSTLGKKDGYPAIFYIPVPLEDPLHSMAIEQGLLKINDYEISREMLDEFGYLQALTWNVQANLLKAETFEDMAPVIDEFLKSLENSKQSAIDLLVSNTQVPTKSNISQQVEDMHTQLTQAITAARLSVEMTDNKKSKQDIAFKEAHRINTQYLMNDQEAQSRIEISLRLRKEARKFLGRTTLLFERLKMPQPNEGSRLRQALAVALSRSLDIWQIKENSLKLTDHPRYLLGATFTTTFLGAILYPEEAHSYVYQVVGFGNIMLNNIHERFMDLYEVVKASVSANGFFHPKQMWQAYISEGPFNRFIIANVILLLGPLLLFTLVHLTIKSVHLLSDLKKQGMPITKQNFIHLQDTQKQDYLISQAMSLLNSEEKGFTEEETLEVIAILNKRSQVEQNSISNFLEKVKAPLKKISFFQDQKSMIDMRIRTFWKAIRNCFFSLQALEKTFMSMTYFWWKYRFLAATYVWKPSTLLGLFYYPNALKTITHEGIRMVSSHPLTDANGGRRPFWREYPLILGKLIGKGPYQAYQEFERYILPIETQIMRHVQHVALNATLQRVKDKALQTMTENASNTYQMIQSLNQEQTRYYALVVDQLFKRVFSKVLSPLFENQACEVSIEECLQYIDQYKAMTLENLKSFHLSQADITDAIKQIENDEFYTQMEAQFNQPHKVSWFERFQQRVNKKLLKNLNPNQNMAIENWLQIEAQMQDAGARSRSTRKTFYQMFEKIPQLFITWAAVSGIMLSSMAGEISESDIMVPLTKDFPYFSGYLFGAGFFASIILEMLAQFGRNLRIEYQLNQQKVFNNIPEGQDMDLNFLSWFLKQMKNKDNTYWKNTKTIWRMVWAGIPANLISFAVIYGLALGRFPLDAYIIGYLLYFAFPIYGLNTKIDQAMEGAMAGYWMKYFPKKLRSHPLAQDYAIKKKNKYRAFFQFFFTFFYSNVLDATLGNLQMMGVKTSREFARIAFLGHPPTVWAVKAFDTIREHIGEVPFVNNIVDTCQKALTNNYDAWDPKIDGPPPDDIIPWEAKNKVK